MKIQIVEANLYQLLKLVPVTTVETIKMVRFTNAEYAAVQFACRFRDGSSLAALRGYQCRYPDRTVMEAVTTSGRSVKFYETTGRNISEDAHLRRQPYRPA